MDLKSILVQIIFKTTHRFIIIPVFRALLHACFLYIKFLKFLYQYKLIS